MPFFVVGFDFFAKIKLDGYNEICFDDYVRRTGRSILFNVFLAEQKVIIKEYLKRVASIVFKRVYIFCHYNWSFHSNRLWAKRFSSIQITWTDNIRCAFKLRSHPIKFQQKNVRNIIISAPIHTGMIAFVCWVNDELFTIRSCEWKSSLNSYQNSFRIPGMSMI